MIFKIKYTQFGKKITNSLLCLRVYILKPSQNICLCHLVAKVHLVAKIMPSRMLRLVTFLLSSVSDVVYSNGGWQTTPGRQGRFFPPQNTHPWPQRLKGFLPWMLQTTNTPQSAGRISNCTTYKHIPFLPWVKPPRFTKPTSSHLWMETLKKCTYTELILEMACLQTTVIRANFHIWETLAMLG